MYRTLSVLILSAALWLGAGAIAQTQEGAKAPTVKKESALDKAVLEAWARHLYVMDSSISVAVSDPKPSPLPGFVEVTVHASKGDRSQDFEFYVSNDGQKIVQGTVWDANQNPFKKDLDLLKTAFSPSIGTPGAPVVLVEFSDFQCPYCKQEAAMLRQNLIQNFPTQVRMYYKEFPLVDLHPWAKVAAIAGRCIFNQNAPAFWEYHDFIYDHQSEVTPENFKEKVLDWAKTAKGIDTAQLGACIDSKATEDVIDKNLAEGHALQVGGTPTLFVNGRRIPNVIDWPTLKAIIDYEIGYQKTAKNAGEDCGCDTTLSLPGMTPATPVPAITKKK